MFLPSSGQRKIATSPFFCAGIIRMMTALRHPAEAHLREQLTRAGLTPERWSNGPHAVYGLHEHPYGKVLLIADGSITFTVGGRHPKVVPMRPGERLELPPHTPHSAVVGAGGVVCLEAHIYGASTPHRS